MDGLLLFAAGVAAGLSVGFLVGAWRTFVLVRRRKAVLGAAAGIARVGLEALPTRSSADILSGRINIVLGGLPYTLPVLPRRASREWIEHVDETFASLTGALAAAGDDTPKILQLLSGQTEGLLSMLRAYDVNGVLPDDEYIDEWATDGEILAAVVEVWRAANPLVATIVDAAADATTDGTTPEPPSSPRESTDGDLTTSTRSSPTSN